MSDKNQPIIQITDQNMKEFIAKQELKIKDLQKKLYIISNALKEEKKKTTGLEQLSTEMKSQIKQLEEEIVHKDEEIIKNMIHLNQQFQKKQIGIK